MKTLFLLLDGLGDLRYRELGGKTPLEYAKTPNLDRLAYNGYCGTLVPLGLGREIPISDASSMLLANLGYDIRAIKPSRGVLEALGAGLKISDGDLCARTNFAVVDSNWRVKQLRLRNFKDGKKLERKINGIKFYAPFKFKATTGYRGVLVFYGKFSDKLIVPDPHKVGAKVRKSSKMLNDFMALVYNELRGEKANFLLIRGLGSRIPKLKKFGRACAITGLEVNKGIAKLLGMDVMDIAEDCPNELALKKKPIEKALKKYDFVLVHFKNTDEPGHDGDIWEKTGQIELTDRFLGKLDLKNKLVIVTSDHCTVCRKKSHTADPIPTMISFGLSKNKRKFGERYCADFRIPSHKLMSCAGLEK